MKCPKLLLAFQAILIPIIAQVTFAEPNHRVLVAIEARPLKISTGTLLPDSLPASDDLFLIQASPPENGTLEVDERGGFIYRPNDGFFGYDAFIYTVGTGTRTSPPVTISIWVAPRRVAFSGRWSSDPSATDGIGWLDNHSRKIILCSFSFEAPDCSSFDAPFDPTGLEPVTIDWDGDELDEIAFFDPVSGSISVTKPTSIREARRLRVVAEDILYEAIGNRLIAGDWDGDQADSLGFYSPRTGRFRLTQNSVSPAPPLEVTPIDLSHSFPFVGDWDGDGTDTVGVLDPKTGLLVLSNDNHHHVVFLTLWGPPGLSPVSGNWSASSAVDSLVGYDRIAHTIETLFPVQLVPRVQLLPTGTSSPLPRPSHHRQLPSER